MGKRGSTTILLGSYHPSPSTLGNVQKFHDFLIFWSKLGNRIWEECGLWKYDHWTMQAPYFLNKYHIGHMGEPEARMLNLICNYHRIYVMGLSCKAGNVRYGGTSKTQNWNYQTFGNFVLKFFQTYVIQLEINNGPPLSTFCSPIMEDFRILVVPP